MIEKKKVFNVMFNTKGRSINSDSRFSWSWSIDVCRQTHVVAKDFYDAVEFVKANYDDIVKTLRLDPEEYVTGIFAIQERDNDVIG